MPALWISWFSSLCISLWLRSQSLSLPSLALSPMVGPVLTWSPTSPLGLTIIWLSCSWLPVLQLWLLLLYSLLVVPSPYSPRSSPLSSPHLSVFLPVFAYCRGKWFLPLIVCYLSPVLSDFCLYLRLSVSLSAICLCHYLSIISLHLSLFAVCLYLSSLPPSNQFCPSLSVSVHFSPHRPQELLFCVPVPICLSRLLFPIYSPACTRSTLQISQL